MCNVELVGAKVKQCTSGMRYVAAKFVKTRITSKGALRWKPHNIIDNSTPRDENVILHGTIYFETIAARNTIPDLI